MTGCLYISPPNLAGQPASGVTPVVMADTVVSYRGVRDRAVPVKPGTVTAATDPEFNSIELFRKLYVFDQAVVAMSGEGWAIREALNQVRERNDLLSRSERPMRWLGELADQANQIYGRSVLKVIGVCRVGEQDVFNYMSAGQPRELKHLGQCNVIGSGADDIWEYINYAERALEGWDPETPGYEKVLTFPHALNAHVLAREIGGHGAAHWGGYIESARYDGLAKEWVRGPRELNVFLVAKETPQGDWETFLVPRMIGYDPGGTNGRVAALSYDGATWSRDDFVLQDLVLGHQEVTPSEQFWATWRPEVATFTLVIGPDERISGKNIATFAAPPAEHLIFYFTGNWTGCGMSPDLHNSISAHLLSTWGVRYKPLSPNRIKRPADFF